MASVEKERKRTKSCDQASSFFDRNLTPQEAKNDESCDMESMNLTDDTFEKNLVCSATSTDADVSLLLNHSVDSEGDFLTDMPKRNTNTLQNLLQLDIPVYFEKPYEALETATDFLQKGFQAVKYNYSND